MKRSLVAFIALGTLFFYFSPTTTAQPTPEQSAQRATEEWLVLVDAEKHAESWEAAAQAFRSAVGKDQWATAVTAARGPLGKLKLRKLKSATYTKTLPGVPNGEYVVVIYESEFENKPAAQETVIPMKDKDSQWRVAAYFVK